MQAEFVTHADLIVKQSNYCFHSFAIPSFCSMSQVINHLKPVFLY